MTASGHERRFRDVGEGSGLFPTPGRFAAAANGRGGPQQTCVRDVEPCDPISTRTVGQARVLHGLRQAASILLPSGSKTNAAK
jgi:hypothetical protein